MSWWLFVVYFANPFRKCLLENKSSNINMLCCKKQSEPLPLRIKNEEPLKLVVCQNALPKPNTANENQWLEDEFPFGKANFQGLC